MIRQKLAVLAIVACAACGTTIDLVGATSGSQSSAGGGTPGSTASSTSGAGGEGGHGGASVVTTSASSSSGAGAGGAPDCSPLTYCECKDAAGCIPILEPCFCPCGVEPCVPDCDCDCGGGAYLGCASKDLGPFEKLIGTWLIGWAGGLNHYSWVRIEPSGVARFLDGAMLAVNSPHWSCNGAGQWGLAQKPDTLALSFPADCDEGFVALTFLDIKPGNGFPSGAILTASVESSSPDTFLEGYKFPYAQCDPQMTSCIDPFL